MERVPHPGLLPYVRRYAGYAAETGLARAPESPTAAVTLIVNLGETLWAGHSGDPVTAYPDGLIVGARRRAAAAGICLARARGSWRLGANWHAANHLGLPPKPVARLIRFEHASMLLRDHLADSIAEVAAMAGYHDQPHLTREFRLMAGLSPGEIWRGYIRTRPGTPGSAAATSTRLPTR